MKIAIFHNLPSGGAKRALYEFTHRLSSLGHYMDLYTLNTSDGEFLPLKPFVRNVFTFGYERAHCKKSRLPVIPRYIRFRQQIENLKRLNELGKKIASVINHIKYDLAYVCECQYMYPPFILRYLKIPSVYYCHEPMRYLYESNILRNCEPNSQTFRQRIANYLDAPFVQAYNCILRTSERKNANAATLILTHSYYSKKVISQVYGISAKVNYLGVNIDKFVPLQIKRKNIVLSVGTLAPHKAFDFIIDAVSLLDPKIRPQVIIVTNLVSPSEKIFLEERALRVHVNLRIMTNISDSELVKWYNRAKVVVYSPIKEPFGLVPLEAMACGTLVVGVAEGGVKETVLDGETGLLTDRNIETFAGAIETLLINEKIRKRISMNVRQYVLQNWSWETSVQNLIGHFKEVLNA